MNTIINSVIKLKSWQKDAYEWYINNKSGSILVVNSCRQVGKTTTIGLIALKASLENSNSDTYIISPTLNQSRHIFKTLSNYIIDIPCYLSINKQLLVIEFKNGSTINFKSAEQEDGLRGFTCRGKGLLIIDEAAFIKEDVFSLILPYTNVNNNSVIYTSTPLFKRGWFWEMYNSTEAFVIDTSNYDLSMFITQEQKEFYKKNLPTQQYIREIEGRFLDMQGSVFGDFSKVILNEIDDSPNEVMSIDWGSGVGNDYTAICILNKSKQLKKLCYFNDKDSVETIDYIKRLYDEFLPRIVIVEKNSIGQVYKDLLQRKLNKNILTFTTTNDTKNKIINRLEVAIREGEIQLLNDPELLTELSTYQRESTSTGKPTYNAPNGLHDDCIMSLAIGYSSLTKCELDLR